MQAKHTGKENRLIKYFKSGDAIIREIAPSYKIHNLLTKIDSETITAVVGEALNHHETTMNTASDRVYFVLEGKITIDGKDSFPGDVIYIPRETEYYYQLAGIRSKT
jgi:ethanolamine utilization protein EutQ (cupin superfamily)